MLFCSLALSLPPPIAASDFSSIATILVCLEASSVGRFTNARLTKVSLDYLLEVGEVINEAVGLSRLL